jgi:hypothetical protein
MVFKVKQRASEGYFKKIYERNDSSKFVSSNDDDLKPTATYNWPYDYFSLVELVKINTEVVFANTEVTQEDKQIKVKPLIKSLKTDQTREPNKIGRKRNRNKATRGKKG